MAKVRQLCQDHDLQLDDDTNTIVRHIMRGAVVSGIKNLLSRDWLICQQLYLISKIKRDSTRQRAFEYIGELLGYNQQASKSKESMVMDVVLGAIDKKGD